MMTSRRNEAQRETEYARLRHHMVREVAAMAAEIGPLDGCEPPISETVMQALRHVPRHCFVDDEQRPFAYQNRPLGIGYGQTISQPYIVACMSDLLRVKPGHRILEIGTGSGYQAAVLAAMGAEVYTLEIVEPLAEQAASTLHALGYTAVHARQGDGHAGWPAFAPYDGIIVTAGARRIPAHLLDQLKRGGRMVIPLGEIYETQKLMLIEKSADGTALQRDVLAVRFVPLTGGAAG